MCFKFCLKTSRRNFERNVHHGVAFTFYIWWKAWPQICKAVMHRCIEMLLSLFNGEGSNDHAACVSLLRPPDLPRFIFSSKQFWQGVCVFCCSDMCVCVCVCVCVRACKCLDSMYPVWGAWVCVCVCVSRSVCVLFCALKFERLIWTSSLAAASKMATLQRQRSVVVVTSECLVYLENVEEGIFCTSIHICSVFQAMIDTSLHFQVMNCSWSFFFFR